MSEGWQAYVKNLFDNAPDVIKKGAIVGLNDSTVWARSEPPIGQTFDASADELRYICGLFQGERYKEAPMSGIHLENTKYLVPFAQEGLIFGKKSGGGAFVGKTNTAVLIALYDGETSECQKCRNAVEKLASYLQSLGY